MALRVVQRHCQERGDKPRPAWFTKERALDSLLRDVAPADLTVVFDGQGLGGDDIPSYILRAAEKGVRVVAGRFGSDARSMKAATKVVLDAGWDDGDIVYFVEDDYVHLPGWAAVMKEAFEHDVADYVTLYDHPDKYDGGVYPRLAAELRVTPSRHWRSTPSTTNTWATRVGRLKRDLPVHSAFVRSWNVDHEKFVALRESGARVASCIPGMSTHCHLPLLSPAVAWGP